MTSPLRPAIGEHFLDSGPLFCLGGSPVLAELFDAHMLRDSRVVAAVVGEVNRNSTLVVPPVGPHPKRRLKQAANAARGRYKLLLASASNVPSPTPVLLTSIKADLAESAKRKLGPGRSLHPAQNDGEAESIYWAATNAMEIVTNDGDAHRIAGERNVVSSSFVEVARHLVRLQKAVKRSEIYKELSTLSHHEIYPGEHITSELDLV